MVELVILDMDGLMFDTENLYFAGWCDALQKMGFEPNKDVFVNSMGLSEENGRKVYKDFYGESLDIDTLWEQTDAFVHKSFEDDGLAIKDGLIELLDYIDEKGLKKAIASSSSVSDIMRNIRLTRLNHSFDYIISGRDLKESKPHPEIFTKVCDGLNVKREAAIVVEDSKNGVRAAYAGGINCIMVPDLIEPDDEMREKSHRIVKSLLDVKAYLEEQENKQ